MKKVLKIVGIIIFVALVVGIFAYFGKKNSQDTQVYDIADVEIGNVKLKAIATGEIKPVETIEIKPNISGVIKSINVAEGQFVEKGQLIAEIKVVPNVSNLNAAMQTIRAAEIQVNLQKKQFNRSQTLYNQGVIPKSDYDNALAEYLK